MDIKPYLFWIPMILIAFANATIREMLLIKYYSEFRAHQLSTIILIIFCAIYIWYILPYLDIQNFKMAFLTGLIWVVLTVAFEFTLGRLTNKSWQYLFEDYNLFAGRILLLFLFSLFFLPYLFYIIRYSK